MVIGIFVILSAVLPITGIVLLISILLVPLELATMFMFLTGARVLVLRLSEAIKMLPVIVRTRSAFQYRACACSYDPGMFFQSDAGCLYDFCGCSMFPKALADKMLRKLRHSLHLGMPNTGIAFTVTMSSCSRHMIRLMESVGVQEEERCSTAGASAVRRQ